MRLYLMRHGQAEPSAVSDSQRALTEFGVFQAREMAHLFSEDTPRSVISSPFLRARQTAQNVVARLERDIVIDTADVLTPDIDPLQTLAWLSNLSVRDPVLLVSHNPLVSVLTSLLVHGHQQQPVVMNTADIVKLEMDHVGAGQARLIWHRPAP